MVHLLNICEILNSLKAHILSTQISVDYHPPTWRWSANIEMIITICDSQFHNSQKFVVFTCLLASQALGKPSKRCKIPFLVSVETCLCSKIKNPICLGRQMKAMKGSAALRRELEKFCTNSSARVMPASLPGLIGPQIETKTWICNQYPLRYNCLNGCIYKDDPEGVRKTSCQLCHKLFIYTVQSINATESS